jgi:NADPH-dependent 2,4-dienoyl-CoA reductase/sulfur reductase-like enzyme
VHTLRTLDDAIALVGIGAQPNVEWLAGSGLEISRGVLTDESGATNLPAVVATGDCAMSFNRHAGRAIRVEHWTNAFEHPSTAVATLLADGCRHPPGSSPGGDASCAPGDR